MKISAPGKIFVSGEWAILEPENFGIVAAVNKRIYAKIEQSPDGDIHITLKDFNIKNKRVVFSNGKIKFSETNPDGVGMSEDKDAVLIAKLNEKEKKLLLFSKTATETALGYLENWRPFKIEVWGDDSRKLGLGFSAASTAAVIAAILAWHEKKTTKEEVFKLSAVSHYSAQGKIGSGFDIAASTYGGIFVYRRFDPIWLKQQLIKEKNVGKIVVKRWPNFYFKKLNVPKGLQLLIGWTGQSALTPQLIKKLHKWREENQSEYKRLMSGIGRLVKELIRAWRLNNRKNIIKLIKKNEGYLRELGKKSGVNIETKKLKKLAEIADKLGGSGKLSGAGAGDCGVAITFNKKSALAIQKEWKKNSILPIPAKLDFEGIKITG